MCGCGRERESVRDSESVRRRSQRVYISVRVCDDGK